MFTRMHFNFLIILLYHRLAAPQTGEHNSCANKSDLKSTVISVKVNQNLIENLLANDYTTIIATTTLRQTTSHNRFLLDIV